MKEELSVSIDEITLMLFPTKENSILDWDENRKEMIQIFLGNSKLEELYGETVQADKSQQQGYTYSLIFPDKPFHFCISWHEIFGNMGICVHFSALAWATYQTDFLENIMKRQMLLIFFGWCRVNPMLQGYPELILWQIIRIFLHPLAQM